MYTMKPELLNEIREEFEYKKKQIEKHLNAIRAINREIDLLEKILKEDERKTYKP